VTTLHLLRHAKSSWKDSSLADVDRPLNSRGRRAVDSLRQYFGRIELDVDLVLVSPAQRTRETWAGIAPAFLDDPRVRFEPAIYGAAADDLLSMLRGVDGAASSVLLIGHNPGVEELAGVLAGRGEDAALADLRHGYPTGGFATLTFDVGWRELHHRAGRLVRFVRPRSLGDDGEHRSRFG
jgi:phosphohistidine phosphatase